MPKSTNSQSNESQESITQGGEAVARALRAGLISPDVLDSNLEPANVVDAVHYIAESAAKVAYALTRRCDIKTSSKSVRRDDDNGGFTVGEAIVQVADAIRDLAAAVRESK